MKRCPCPETRKHPSWRVSSCLQVTGDKFLGRLRQGASSSQRADRPAQSVDGTRRTRIWTQRSRSSAARSSSPVRISRQESSGSASSRARTPASSMSVKLRPSGLWRCPRPYLKLKNITPPGRRARCKRRTASGRSAGATCSRLAQAQMPSKRSCHATSSKHRHVLPQQERRLPGHLGRGVESLDPETRLPESQRVPPRPATGIEDEPAGTHMRQKTGIQGPQIHIMGCRSIAGRALVIECRIRCHGFSPFPSSCRNVTGHRPDGSAPPRTGACPPRCLAARRPGGRMARCPARPHPRLLLNAPARPAKQKRGTEVPLCERHDGQRN